MQYCSRVLCENMSLPKLFLLLFTLIAGLLRYATASEDTGPVRYGSFEDVTLQQLCQSLAKDTQTTTRTAAVVAIYNLSSAYFGTGADGVLIVNELEDLKVNRFAQVLHTASKGNNKLKVDYTNVFTAAKEVYIIQMKGTNAGQSMFARVTAVDSKNSVLIISSGLTFNCNSTGNNRCQVVTVPHFENVALRDRATISGAPWNGRTGGIIVFRSKQQVNVGPRSSHISACGIGYRGGKHAVGPKQDGFQGESYVGYPNTSIEANNGGGGGGMVSRGSCCIGGGGGGGGHSSPGESPRTYNYGGVQAAKGGKAYGTPSLTEKIFIGSGGGGGARDQDCCALPGAGGNGGGIIIIATPKIVGSGGNITSCGARGQDAGHNAVPTHEEEGGGGGGAGGSVLLITRPAGVPTDGSVIIDVTGGVGGKETDPGYYAPGGKGADGKFTSHVLPKYDSGPLSLY